MKSSQSCDIFIEDVHVLWAVMCIWDVLEDHQSFLWSENSWQTVGLISANSSGYFCRDQHVASPSALPAQLLAWTQVRDVLSTQIYRLGDEIFIWKMYSKAAVGSLSEDKAADWRVWSFYFLSEERLPVWKRRSPTLQISIFRL